MIPLFVYAASPWDKYTISGDKQFYQFLEWRAEKMSGWTPWFDATLKYFNKPSGVYLDAYAIYNNNPPNPTDPAITNPEWILTDNSGNRLYIPWNCANGICPQFAGDIRNKSFVQHQITWIDSIIQKGYNLIYLDDVNLEYRVSDGNGNAVHPDAITNESWAYAMADFMTKIRNVFPYIQIVHNSIWFTSAPKDAVDQEIKAANFINCERGFGDANLNPATFNQFMNFIDHVHSLDRNVIQMEYSKDNLSFKIACFLLCYEDGDLMNVADLFPDAWDSQMDVNFGAPLGNRMNISGNQWQREFSKVLVNVDFDKKIGTISQK